MHNKPCFEFERNFLMLREGEQTGCQFKIRKPARMPCNFPLLNPETKSVRASHEIIPSHGWHTYRLTERNNTSNYVISCPIPIDFQKGTTRRTMSFPVPLELFISGLSYRWSFGLRLRVQEKDFTSSIWEMRVDKFIVMTSIARETQIVAHPSKLEHTSKRSNQ